jgi:thioredoxin 1
MTDLSTFTGIVKFSASWCQPCKALAPIVEKVTQENNVDVVDVDIDEEPELAQQFNVRAIPYVISFRDGQPLGAFGGLVAERDLIEFIDKSGLIGSQETK